MNSTLWIEYLENIYMIIYIIYPLESFEFAVNII